MNEIYNNIQHEMNGYPFSITPPSSSEDSPQGFQMQHSPSFNIYQSPPQVNLPQFIISSQAQYDIPITNLYLTEPKPPYLTITEQPIDKFRFRYKSEMAGTHGSLTGINSDKTRKQTYPTVQLKNFFDGEVIIRCSLYQHGSSDDRNPHAHRLIKKQGQDELDDPHNMVVTQKDDYIASFHSMGIIHTAKKHIAGELKRKKTLLKEEDIARKETGRRNLSKREEADINNSVEEESKSINLNIVCLRFDAFQQRNNIFYPICKPVYSHTINNLKSALTGELKIVRMDHSSSPAKGSREIFMLVEKVTKKNIKIRFFEVDEDDTEIWSEYGKFNDLDVHHQYAIVFRTPPYKDLEIQEQRKVFIELERPSDGSKSEPREFTYIPSLHYKTGMKRPRTSMMYSSSGEYSSNSLNSAGIPTTIEQLQNPITDFNLSEELANALPAMDSEEFRKMFSENRDIFTKSLEYAVDSERKTSATTMDSTIDNKDKQIIARVTTEFSNFMKSKPKLDNIVGMLNKLFTKHLNDAKENALHLIVVEGNLRALRYWLDVIQTYKQYQFLNMPNSSGETVAHLALQQPNVDIITTLLTYPCNLSMKDNNGNTALHLAVMRNHSNLVIDTLLRSPYGNESYINVENDDDLTALHMAVKMNKPKYVEILYKYKVDVNTIDKKTGRNSLHIAITEQGTEIVKLLLEKTNIDILKEDFSGFSPFKMAKHLARDMEPERVQILKMIEKVLFDKGLHSECIVKEEVESEEEMETEMVECKTEKLTFEELEPMYKHITEFTPLCLEEASRILDMSGNWKRLARDLELEHILQTDMMLKAKSPSKELLKIAIRLVDIITIRKCLESLSELDVIATMDNMVTATKMET